MAIPESQLKTWSNQGATITAQNTHQSIRIALNAYTSPLKKKGFVEGRDFEIYLQGSYRNTTNIRGDSDVDVVVQFNETFESDVSGLSAMEQIKYEASYQIATYQWADFRADVLEALLSYYGRENVDDTGNKSLKLKKGSNRLAADIIPCFQYRHYLNFWDINNQSFIEGIKFYTRRGNWPVVNYPKLHYKKGAEKNSLSCANGWYKPVVRVFKNTRIYLVDAGIISKTLAPSYFLECLLYNVPNNLFGVNYQVNYRNIIKWLYDSFNYFDSFVCQNEQLLLFGTAPEQWSVKDAQELIIKLINLWNKW